MYIERDLKSEIEKYIKRKEIIAIVGARQCGKTTLLKKIYSEIKTPKKESITFEDQKILNMFSNNIDLFIETYIKDNDYLFIDEFQYAKNGGKQLKFIYDTNKIKIFITGSSAPDLAVHGLKYLVGRVFIFKLYALSFPEFLRFKNKKLYDILLKKKISKELWEMLERDYEEFLIYGGYPEVVLSKEHDEKIKILENIYNTYFLREIKEILQLSDNFKLEKLMKMLSLQIGSPINYSELSSSVGSSHIELLKNLNILKQTFICIELKPFFSNKKKEIIKSPQFFFFDSGLRNILINNFQKMEERVDIGKLNENFVASELIKKGYDIKYWRTKAKAEVDFILEKNAEIIPIEVKSKLKSKKITRSFRNFLEMYSPKRGYVLNNELAGTTKISESKINFLGLVEVMKI